MGTRLTANMLLGGVSCLRASKRELQLLQEHTATKTDKRRTQRSMIRSLNFEDLFFFAVLLSKGFVHGHTTSTLSTGACQLEYFEAEKTPGLISLVVYEAETIVYLGHS